MESLNKIIEGLFDADIDKALEEFDWSLDWIKDDYLKQYLYKEEINFPECALVLSDCKKLVDDMNMSKEYLGKLLQIFKLIQELPSSRQKKYLMQNIIDPIFYIEQLDYCYKFIDLMSEFLTEIDKIACKKPHAFKFLLVDDQGNDNYQAHVAFDKGFMDDKDFKPFERMKNVEIQDGDAYSHIKYNFDAKSIVKSWKLRKKELNSLKK